MPAFVRSVKESMPGYSSAANNGSIIGNAVGAATTTETIPATGATTPSAGGTAFNLNGGPPPTRGRGRIRTSSVGGGATTTIQSVTVTDGVTTLLVFSMPISQANQALDVSYEFNTDLNITSTSMVIVTAVAGATIDWEVSMTP